MNRPNRSAAMPCPADAKPGKRGCDGKLSSRARLWGRRGWVLLAVWSVATVATEAAGLQRLERTPVAAEETPHKAATVVAQEASGAPRSTEADRSAQAPAPGPQSQAPPGDLTPQAGAAVFLGPPTAGQERPRAFIGPAGRAAGQPTTVETPLAVQAPQPSHSRAFIQPSSRPPDVRADSFALPAERNGAVEPASATPSETGAVHVAQTAGTSTPATRTLIAPEGNMTVPIPGSVPPSPAEVGPEARVAPEGPQSGYGGAPESAEVLGLTPGDAARIAIENSTDLTISAANIEQAQAEVIRALGLDDVRVSVSATAGRRRVATSVRTDGDGGAVGGGDPDFASASLSASKTIFTEGRIKRTQRAAVMEVEAARLSQAVVTRALRLTAHEATYEVLRTDQLAHVAAQQANAVATHLELSKELHAAGSVARFEVVQAETELARSQGEVIAARTALEQAKSTLKRLLTLPQSTAIAVSPGQEYEGPSGTQEDLIGLAVAQRPEVSEARASVRIAETNLKLARDSRNVSVSVGGSLSAADSRSGTDWQVALSLDKPILDGKAERSEVLRAQAGLKTAGARLQQTEQDVAREVAQYHIALGDAQERLRVARQGVVEGRERLDIAKVRYENGYGLGIEVLDGRTSLTGAEAEVVNARYNLQVAIIQLRSATGSWDEDSAQLDNAN